MSDEEKEYLSNVFRKFLQVLNAVNDNCVMKINERGLEFVSIDDNHICLAEAFISREAFPKWKVIKESYASINLGLIKKIFVSNTLIEGVKQNNNSEMEIFVGNPLKISLLIRSDLENEDIDTQIKHATNGTIFFEAIIPSKELMILLRIAKQAFDEISFCVSMCGVIWCSSFVHFRILKPLTANITNIRLKSLKFSVPMRYFSAILPALSLSDKLKISLTDREIVKILLSLNSERYKLSLFIS